MTIDRQDLDKLAGRLRWLGDQLEANGTLVWATTRDWQRGARATNPDPDSGGNRWWTDHAPDCDRVDCDCETFQVPQDPTGDQVDDGDPAADIHDRLTSDLTTIARLIESVTDTMLAAVPRIPQVNKRDKANAQLIAEGWCVSCHRDDQHLKPIETRPDGSRYYATMCRWCGEFTAAHKRRPPVPLLEVHHRGGRISVRLVAESLAADRKPRPKRKRRKAA